MNTEFNSPFETRCRDFRKHPANHELRRVAVRSRLIPCRVHVPLESVENEVKPKLELTFLLAL